LVNWDIHRLRTCRLDDDRIFLDDDTLLFGCLQTSGVLRLATQSLYRVENGCLLVYNGVAELLGPV
jgi:hypothetical protein